MPTGFTAILDKYPGITFRQFTLWCARHLREDVSQSDNPSDEPPTDDEPNSYYFDVMRVKKYELAAIENMTDEEFHKMILKEDGEVIERAIVRLRNAELLKVTYETMKSLVKAWTPPTTGHSWLKDFMLQQLEDSIRFDCCCEYTRKEARRSNKYIDMSPRALSVEKTQRLLLLRGEIQECQKAYEEEVDRVARRNEWNRQLYASLPQ